MKQILAIAALAAIAASANAGVSVKGADQIKKVEAQRQEAVATGTDTIQADAAAQIKRVEARRQIVAHKPEIAGVMKEDVTNGKGADLVAAKGR